MIVGENLCRFCLKFTSETEQVSLFDDCEEKDYINWRRIFSFVFHCDGLPDQICRSCKSQVAWIGEFYRTVFENDRALRNELIKEELNLKGFSNFIKSEGKNVKLKYFEYKTNSLTYL